MKKNFSQALFYLIITAAFLTLAQAQNIEREFTVRIGGSIEIKNLYGRIDVKAIEENQDKVTLKTDSDQKLSDSNIKIDYVGSKLKIETSSQKSDARIDLILQIPVRLKVRVETDQGQISIAGDFESAEAETTTGTIYADVPATNLEYKFLWSATRPRIVSDIILEEAKEKSAGKFVVAGKIYEESKDRDLSVESEIEEEQPEEVIEKNKVQRSNIVSLNFRTSRGIILLNVPPNEVPSDLTERPLTEAAKAVIRSGDSFLTEAIRRASPKYFGDYAATLPPRKNTPVLSLATKTSNNISANLKKVSVQVVDINNRSVTDLEIKDFVLTERGDEREILSVEPTTDPFNLVLLLDVSGSVENYVDFIRKAARNFVNTVGPQDKISIVIFNEDVKSLSTFTTDKNLLSESVDTFDAGGGTAYYDAIAYTLTETLRPMKGERTAIVVLSDGDDNRSFLPFNSLLGSIQESGALIYPLYVPSGLIAASESFDPNKTVDPLRNRFLSQTLTSKAQEEGEELAKISGGVYYPISRLSELQTAYDDIVKQLRTAYTITYRSNLNETDADRASPRLKVKVKKDNTFVKLGTVVALENREISQNVKKKSQTQRSQRKQNLENENISQNFFSTIRFQNFSFEPVPETSFYELPEITGEISHIKYKQFLADKLRRHNFETFDINKTAGAFLFEKDAQTIAISRWISPKRTRSYPYERVYDTLVHSGKKVAIIPVVKDEGLGGDRDFIQWDTISLLSLLDVHVVLAYYSDAIKNPKRKDKITKQKFDNEFIQNKLNEVINFKGDAREWNEQESKNLQSIFEKAKIEYRKIAQQTKTYLHNESKLDELIKYTETPQRFIGYSRRKSKNAQTREFLTIQPNEALSTLSKGRITITNALFGKYYFTVDETLIEPKTLSLIEAKHSSRSKMPSKNDIKDGLIKMMLYTNLQKVKFGEKSINYKVKIRLTSSRLEGSINSNASQDELEIFAETNLIKLKQKQFIQRLFQEAQANNFTIILENGETAK